MSIQQTHRPLRSTLIRGRVFLEKKASFAWPGEALEDHGQLPQYHPRTNPAPPYVEPGHRYEVEDDYANALAQIAQNHSSLPQMPAFRASHEPGHYRGIDWHEHVGHCHNMLYSHLVEGREGAVGEDQLQSLLAIVSYGMGHSMTWLPHFEINSHRKNGEYIATRYTPFSDMFMGGDPAEDAFTLNRQRIAGKRWLVAPLAYPDHWGMSIFDRERGHLFILDTGSHMTPLTRDERIQSAVHAWARFWNEMGLPYHFQYFVPISTPQPHGFECGWLGAYWVMQVLRDQVGERIYHWDAHGKVRDIPIGNYEPSNYPHETTDLYVRDWFPKGHTDPTEGFKEIMDTMRSMLRNELGPEPQKLSSREKRAQDAAQYICRPDGTPRSIPHQLFWTSQGGMQMSWPPDYQDDHTLKEYHPGQSRRRHPSGTPQEGILLNNLPGPLPTVRTTPDQHNPPTPPNITFRKATYTAANPLVPRNHPPKLSAGQSIPHTIAPNSCSWEHDMQMYSSHGTDNTGQAIASRRNTSDLRLQFFIRYWTDDSGLSVYFRPSFMGGDYGSFWDHLDIPLYHQPSRQPSSSGSPPPPPPSYSPPPPPPLSPKSNAPNSSPSDPGPSNDGSPDTNNSNNQGPSNTSRSTPKTPTSGPSNSANSPDEDAPGSPAETVLADPQQKSSSQRSSPQKRSFSDSQNDEDAEQEKRRNSKRRCSDDPSAVIDSAASSNSTTASLTEQTSQLSVEKAHVRRSSRVKKIISRYEDLYR